MSSHATRGSWSRRALAVAGSAVLMVGVGVVTAPAALAAGPDTSASHASAQYLSGTWNTTGATADYTGNGTETPGAAVDQSNDIASLVSTIPGLQINGAFGNEYAHAGSGGSSWAASGRVTGAGGAGAAAPANVNVDLGALLAAAGIPNNIVEKMQLSLQEVSSIAKLDVAGLGSNTLANGCGADWSNPTITNCRGYGLKSGTLHIESSAIAGVMAQIKTLAGQIDAAIGTYYTGAVPTAVSDALIAPVNTWLQDNVVGRSLGGIPQISKTYVSAASVDPTASVITATVTGTVASALATIFAAPHSVNGVSVNFGAGTIDVNWGTVLGGLNDLPPNSPLFGTAVVTSITDSLNDILDGIAAEVAAAIPTLLDAVTINLSGTLAGSVTISTDLRQLVCAGWSCHFEWVHQPDVNVAASATVGYSGTLWDLLSAGGTVSVATSVPLPAPLPPLSLPAFSVDLGSVVPGGILGSVTGPAIAAITQSIADLLKPIGAAAVQGIADLMNSASSVFGGTINVQSGDATTGFQVSALELRFGSAAPLRSGSAFKAAPRPGAVVAPGATVRLATSIVGPNRDALTCVAGMHYDPKTGTCVKDSTPGGGGPGGGGGTPTTPPTTTATTEPTTEVLGTSDTVSPQSPSVTVAGESDEVTTTEVVGLAETGPRQLGLIALLGLELLLGGIAVMRLTARRRRAAHHQHHA